MKRIIFSLVIVLMLVTMACSHAPAIPQISQPSNGVKVQVGMVLDGSSSINSTNWDIMVTGLAAAVNSSDCMPQDGSVELTVIQFAGWSSPGAQLEIGPVVITAANVADVASNITAISQMTGYTPLSCGIRLAADTLAASSNFDPDIKQAINIVTDGVPNRCCPGEWDCGGCGVYGCDEAYDSAVAARNYTITTLNMTDDQDEIDVEGIGITDANRDWLKNNIILPATGYSHPPEGWPPPGPGWVRVFATFAEFVPSLCEKFQFIVYGSITAHKFNDLNGDGDQNGGEADLSGWTMTLYSGSDCSGSSLASNETDANGDVVFAGLEAGTYSVEETLEGGWTNSTALCQNVTIVAGESATLNFGNLCISPTAAFTASPTSGCAPLSVNFTDQSTGNPTSWNWSFPGGTPSSHTGQTPPPVTYNSAGSYNVTLTVSNSCGSDDETKTNYITVYAPPTASASSNSPVCEGATIELTGGPNGMTSYNWSGPGGWTSSAQNATRSGATTAMAGTYTLTVTNSNGCSDNESTSVVVNAKPTATASSNSPVCEGSTIELYGGLGGMTTYSWTGPGGWTSSAQNATRSGATLAMVGNYTLTVTDSNGCSDDESTSVTVNTKPTASASSNSPVCEGSTIELYGGPGGMTTYSWSGPGGWTSNAQNATRSGATLAMAGNYILTVTDGGCVSDPAGTSVVVNAKPTATASSNSPVCEGATIELTGGPNGMTSYNWTGPGGWTSSAQNATRSGATTAMAGTYTLTVTNSNGCSDDESTSVTVNTKPTASASSNSPVCEGSTIELYGGLCGMTTYSWTGPGGWTSSLQNPTRSNATTAMAGTYTLTVTNGGCTSNPASTVMAVNAKPTATASSNSPVSEGATIALTGGPNGMTSYNWTGPGGWTNSAQNATRSGATTAMAGTYTLTVTNSNGCTDVESTSVTVSTNEPPYTVCFCCQLTISSTEGGSVTTPSEGEIHYDGGTVVDLVASPDSGYKFVNWSGDVDTIADVHNASTTIKMCSCYSIIANFEIEEATTPVYSTVTTQVATDITTNSATLNMNYTTGDLSLVGVRFAYKKSTDLTWAYAAWVSKTADGTHTALLTGLNSDTTYDFKAQLKGSDIVESTTLQFTTDKSSTPPPSTGWCFIATTAYGTPTAEQIDVLREFRDVVLLESAAGSQFVAIYYQLSPPVAEFIAGNELLRTLVRELLVDPLVWVVEATGAIWQN
jgi:PKD repeat protein